MKVGILFLMTVLVVACIPVPATVTKPATSPPDAPVTSPPDVDMSTSKPFTNPFAPKPGDEKLTRGTIFIKNASLMIRESYPPQISLAINGDLPTPCHELRMQIASADSEHKIRAEAYSVVDQNVSCTQVLKPFEENIDLGTFPSGHYSVWLNGKLAGEFDS